MEELDSKGGCVVITGAASGIGRALAEQVGEPGVELALADIDEAALQVVADALRVRGLRVLARRVDVSVAEDVEGFARAVFDWAESPVVLVFANAGIHGLTSGLDPDLKVWNRVIDVNLKGPVHMSAAFIRRLIDQGRPAQFVITGSQGSFVAAPGMAPYIATKHALWGFADSLRLELAQAGAPVQVSLAAPSRVVTGMTRGQIDQARATRGEAAAQAYEASMIGPEPIAEVMLREAKRRAFWIIPSHESVADLLRARVDAVLSAMPAGRITLPSADTVIDCEA